MPDSGHGEGRCVPISACWMFRLRARWCYRLGGYGCRYCSAAPCLGPPLTTSADLARRHTMRSPALVLVLGVSSMPTSGGVWGCLGCLGVFGLFGCLAVWGGFRLLNALLREVSRGDVRARSHAGLSTVAVTTVTLPQYQLIND